MATITIDPAAAIVPADGGVSSHILTNPSDKRLAFKVKSTNNDHYRIKPVYGFVDPSGTATLEVTRTAGPAKDDKFVIQLVEIPADATDAEAAFKASTVAGEVNLPVSAQ